MVRTLGSATVVSALLLAGCGGDLAPQTYQGQTMGTSYRVIADCLADMTAAIAEELDLVNGQMSTYLPESELSRFNRSPGDQWFAVSEPLLDVLSAAQTVSRASGGALDVTVGPLVNLWGFGPEVMQSATPSAGALVQAKARVGHARLELRRQPPGVKKPGEVQVDLSALAKGYGVDRVAERLQVEGCTDYLVEVGGELRVRGTNAAGQPWRIGVEVPDPQQAGGIQRVLSLDGTALATSGNYRNYRVVQGKRYSHTIDPRTGSPVTHALASVTVLHESALWADAYATAINVLGPEEGWRLAQSLELPILLIVRRENGYEERYTARFEPYLL